MIAIQVGRPIIHGGKQEESGKGVEVKVEANHQLTEEEGEVQEEKRGVVDLAAGVGHLLSDVTLGSVEINSNGKRVNILYALPFSEGIVTEEIVVVTHTMRLIRTSERDTVGADSCIKINHLQYRVLILMKRVMPFRERK